MATTGGAGMRHGLMCGVLIGVTAACLGVFAGRAAAQGCGCPAGWTCPEGSGLLSYTGDITPNCLQHYRVFLPDPAVAGTKPPEGWPVVIVLSLSLFTISNDT